MRNGSVPIGVVISRNVRVDNIDPKESINTPLRLGQSTESLTQMLDLLRQHCDGKALLACSMQGFMDSVSGLNNNKQVCHLHAFCCLGWVLFFFWMHWD